MLVGRRATYHAAIKSVFHRLVFTGVLNLFPRLILEQCPLQGDRRLPGIPLQGTTEAAAQRSHSSPPSRTGQTGRKTGTMEIPKRSGELNWRKPLLIVHKLYRCNDFQGRDCSQHTRRVKRNNSCQQMNL